MAMGEDRHEGLSPAGPAEDGLSGMPMATPPFTDGHPNPEEAGSQVLLTDSVHSRLVPYRGMCSC